MYKRQDIVYTPIDVARDCIEFTKPFLSDTDFLYEPFSGEDAFYNNFPKGNPKDWSEIERRRDFFDSDIIIKKTDWIISNPPYSLFNEILPKMLECKKGFCVLVNNLTITPTRLNKINKAGFYISLIYYFKIYHWFGYQFYYIFEKRKDKKNILEMKYRQQCYKETKEDIEAIEFLKDDEDF